MKDMMIEIKISKRSNHSKLKTLGINLISSIISRVISSVILKFISHFINL